MILVGSKWEKFEDPASKSKKLQQAAKHSENTAVCAADAALAGNPQWTALGDERYVEKGGGALAGPRDGRRSMECMSVSDSHRRALHSSSMLGTGSQHVGAAISLCLW